MWIDAIVLAGALFVGHLVFPDMLPSSFVMKLSLAISVLTIVAELTIVTMSS